MQTVRNIEISNSCDEFEWEDHVDLAREIIEGLRSEVRLMWITAGNVDWLQRSAYAVKAIPEADRLWTTIAGWDNADWTLRIAEITPEKIMATAYSHDTPTGGGRVVTFMDGELIYRRLLDCGWTYPKLVHELWWRDNGNVGRWNKELVIDILQNDLTTDELLEMF